MTTNNNQMLDLMKANMLMSNQGNPIYTFVIMSVLEFALKYIKLLTESFQKWIERWANNKFQNTVTKLNIDSVKCEIIFQRRFSQKGRAGTDDQTTVDAVLSRVIDVPEIKAVIYSRTTYIVNYQEEFLIYPKIYFQLIGSEYEEGGELDSIRFRVFCKEQNMEALKKYINEVVDAYELRKKYRLGNHLYFFDHLIRKKDGYGNKIATDFVNFTRTIFQTNRDLDNVFFQQKEEVKTRLELFLKRPDWYQKRGIPHTLGFLMHGSPGSGKTSSIKAIANLTQRHIINVNLGQIKCKTQLKQLFHDEKIWVMEKSEVGEKLESYVIPIDKRLYVMEDVDSVDGGSILFRRSDKFKKPVALGPESGATGTLNPSATVALNPNTRSPSTLNANTLNEYLKIGDVKPILEPSAELTGYDSGTGNCSSANFNPGGIMSPPGNRNPYDPSKPEEIDPDEKVDLSYILNILDGTLETPGRIIIITSNYPEKLDQALIRPGRIDLILHYEKADKAYIYAMYECFFECKPDSTLIEQIEDRKWTPAEVNQILFKNYNDGPEALKTLGHADPKKYFKLSYFDDTYSDKEKKDLPPAPRGCGSEACVAEATTLLSGRSPVLPPAPRGCGSEAYVAEVLPCGSEACVAEVPEIVPVNVLDGAIQEPEHKKTSNDALKVHISCSICPSLPPDERATHCNSCITCLDQSKHKKIDFSVDNFLGAQVCNEYAEKKILGQTQLSLEDYIRENSQEFPERARLISEYHEMSMRGKTQLSLEDYLSTKLTEYRNSQETLQPAGLIDATMQTAKLFDGALKTEGTTDETMQPEHKNSSDDDLEVHQLEELKPQNNLQIETNLALEESNKILNNYYVTSIRRNNR